MKILIISDAWKPQLNGVVRTYEYLMTHLQEQGHDVKIIGPDAFPARFKLPGYAEIELAVMPYRRLAAMIDAYRPDTIHIATEAPLGRAARRYCLKHGLHYTSCYHTHFPDYIAKRLSKYLPLLYNPVRNMAISSLRKFHNTSSCLMVATQSLEDDLKSWHFTAPMHHVTRGVLTHIFKPAEKTRFTSLKTPVALYVGRVAIEKNIHAFADMVWDGSKVIVGDGPSLSSLKQRYSDIHFAGRQMGDDLAAHYNSADIFVFPSKTDTFGMVLVEALACGLPIAAYDVTGPKDIVTEPFLGALTHDNLAEAATQALARKEDSDKRIAHVHTHFTWETATQQFLDGCIPVRTDDKAPSPSS